MCAGRWLLCRADIRTRPELAQTIFGHEKSLKIAPVTCFEYLVSLFAHITEFKLSFDTDLMYNYCSVAFCYSPIASFKCRGRPSRASMSTMAECLALKLLAFYTAAFTKLTKKKNKYALNSSHSYKVCICRVACMRKCKVHAQHIDRWCCNSLFNGFPARSSKLFALRLRRQIVGGGRARSS